MNAIESILNAESAMGVKTEQALLVIEDDATQRDLYRFSLESVGYRVITAADGSEGLQAIEQHEVALVLCDECMTPMSAHEFLEQTTRPTPAKTGKGLAESRHLRSPATLVQF